MVQSMTGYGRAEDTGEQWRIVVEIKSVNHRFLDISVRNARSLSPVEQEIKKLVSARVPRGKVDVAIQLECCDSDRPLLHADAGQIRHVRSMIDLIKAEAGVTAETGLADVLLFRDCIVRQDDNETDEASAWASIRPCLERALQELYDMQVSEGDALCRDMRGRLRILEDRIRAVEQRMPEALALRREALRERLAALLEGAAVEEDRFLQEIALMADKSDITEELVRAKSHIKQFASWLDSAEPIGRRLDFLLQEINREFNTIGAKASDADISLQVVESKNELEKIREQVQNIV